MNFSAAFSLEEEKMRTMQYALFSCLTKWYLLHFFKTFFNMKSQQDTQHTEHNITH